MVHSKREEDVSSSSVLLLRLALAVTGICFVVTVCLVAVYLTTLSTGGKQLDQHSTSSVISSDLTNTTLNHHSIENPIQPFSLWQMPSTQPSQIISTYPSTRNSANPSLLTPSQLPSTIPSQLSSNIPSQSPTTIPSQLPSTSFPSKGPTIHSSPLPSFASITYQPGNLTGFYQNIIFSKGLRLRLLARKNQPVVLADGTKSAALFHERPDFGATFSIQNDRQGWIYVSNSERPEANQGGVGALQFDEWGNVVGYRRILSGTTNNCGGGRTPWGTWISCEEVADIGQAYQIDVQGNRMSLPISMGRGRFESFAYDVRDVNYPRFFLTEDAMRGAIRRFTPTAPNWKDPWTMLHGNGTLEYLVLNQEKRTFSWTLDIVQGKNSAEKYFPECEGIDVYDGTLVFVSKKIKQLFILNLDSRVYTNSSVISGSFDGSPDQIVSLENDAEDILYFTEEGGKFQGIHGRNSRGQFFTILEGKYKDETTGLAFSPNGMFMYFAFQKTGTLWEVSREDGFPFQGRSLNINFHNVPLFASRKI